MRRTRWKAITHYRLKKNEISEDYMDDPFSWYQAIAFEIQNYGTSMRKRFYLMRRWHKRILPLKDQRLRLGLMSYVSYCLAKKVKDIEKWKGANAKSPF